MTTDLVVLQKGSWWKYWPVWVAAIIGPALGNLLARWLPFHLAIGVAGFAGWFFVGLIFARRSRPKYGIPRWLVPILTGLGAGLAAGVMAYYIPWK